MKAGFLFTAVTILFAVSFAQGAHLTSYEGGGLWGQVDRYIYDSDTEVPSDAVSHAGGTWCQANNSGATEYSWAYAWMFGEVTSASYWGYEIGTAVNIMSQAECQSYDSNAQLWSYGTVETVVPAYTGGIFFVIEPDEGETAGQPVRVQWRWNAEAYGITGNSQASVGSGTIYLTRGVMPPAGTPTTGIMWSRESVTFTEDGSEEETGSFVAQIGDVIGVFSSANTNSQLSGEGYSSVNVSTSMEMLAGEAMPQLIEYPYAPGLVYDPCRNITFLKDWSAAAGSMNWDDANDWAQNFIYYSGGVQYSNWRLPTTIDEQGTSVGEFGFLNTNYGISEAYFGPFTNISAGDYWTSPQFARGEDPNIAYAFTFSTTYGPAQWQSPLTYECPVIPVFDGPPTEFWCPADFNNDGIVDFKDFAVFASYWLNQRVSPAMVN